MNRQEKIKELMAVLPYIPAVLLFFFSFSFWRKGYTSGALIFGLTGLGFLVLPIVLHTIRKLMANDRRFMIVAAIVVFGCSLYAWIQGEIYSGLFATLVGIFLICGQFFYSQKQKGSRWSSTTWQFYIPIALGLITFGPLLYLEYVSENKTHTVGKEGDGQKQVVDKSKEPTNAPKAKTAVADDSSQMSKMVDIINQNLPPEQREDPTVQKLMGIMASESFQQQMEQQNPQTPDEILQLFAAQGLTEAKEIDLKKILAEKQKGLQAAYNARNPGKDPASEDDVMADRFAESMRQHGPLGGMTQFMRDKENAEWIGFRFKDDPEGYRAWTSQVRKRVETGRVSREPKTAESGPVASTSATPPNVDVPTPLQTDIPASEKAIPDAVVELEDDTIVDTENRAVTPSAIEPEKVVTEVSPQPPAPPTEAEFEATLRERFSSERFDRAMDTLDRYGEEEGLRRLKKEDPEVAEQVERQRNREKLEESEQ